MKKPCWLPKSAEIAHPAVLRDREIATLRPLDIQEWIAGLDADGLSPSRTRQAFGATKPHQQRTIAMPGFLTEMLAVQLAGGTQAGSDPLVFTSPHGHPLRYRNFGLDPGRPLTAYQLGQRLRHLGIDPAAGRRAALTDLAAQLPAAVLARVLNLAPTTAVRWVRAAGGDWTTYAAQIIHDRDREP
jgi:hypothetical protein